MSEQQEPSGDDWNMRMSTSKTRLLMERGFEISGFIMTHPKSGDRQLVEMGAVRKLTKDEMWNLMHPVSVPMPLNLGIQQEESAFEYEGHKFKPCPFCKAGSFSVRLNRVWTGMKYSEPSAVEIFHYCVPIQGQPSRPIVRVGRDVESAVAAWNMR